MPTPLHTPTPSPMSPMNVPGLKKAPQRPELKLVKVAGAENEPEADFLRNLLLEQRVPSLLRRAPGFDVPDFLAAGPRDILVPASYAQVARDVLLHADPEPHLARPNASDSPLRVVTGVLTGTVLAAIIVWLGTEMIL